MQVESAVQWGTPEEIFSRVCRELRPRSRDLSFTVQFCQFANPDSFARLEEGAVQIRLSDLFEGAPERILEALAFILLGKLFRRPISAVYTRRYHLYLNQRDFRRSAHLVRQTRGRKFVSGPQGDHYNLEAIFEELNFRHFHGLMARPQLGWSRQPSRTMLGHYDPSHNAIILSKLLDGPAVPALAVEYVMFHEMLHLRYPTETDGVRRRVHTREFRQAEREFPGLHAAKEMLKKI
jgi:hypothetical protein